MELTEKIEADFYTQDVAGAKPQEPPENKTPVATKITGKMILEAIRQMDAEERRRPVRVPSTMQTKRKTRTRMCSGFLGAMEGTRTPGLLIRSQSLYPAELPTHTFRSEHDVFYHEEMALSTAFLK